MTIPSQLIKIAKTHIDLRDVDHAHSLFVLANNLLKIPNVSSDELKAAAVHPGAPLEFRVAAKLVESKRFVEQNNVPVKIGVVFAMWGEHNRLRPKSPENPNGENSLRTKLEQLDWLTNGSTIDWRLYAVDDGSPDDDGALARQIAASHPLGKHVTILNLGEHIPTNDGPLAPLTSPNDFRKGGAVILGCLQAIEDGMDAVIYTDADNSVHLGQLGLLLKPFITDNKRVVLGNRKHPEAVLVKAEARWGIGIKVLRHMQRMVGQAIFSKFKDTQAAFKLYDASVLRKILEKPTVFDFSFDTDWILAVLAMDESYAVVPFAFIDSFAESASITQGPMTTWEMLIKGLVKAVRARGIPHNEAMARVIDEEIHSHEDLQLLINHLPPELETAGPEEFGNPEIMSPEAVQKWIQARKRENSESVA